LKVELWSGPGSCSVLILPEILCSRVGLQKYGPIIK
jgi:hypothetical protein